MEMMRRSAALPVKSQIFCLQIRQSLPESDLQRILNVTHSFKQHTD